MTILIIGGTGTLGRQIVRKAIEEGFSVRCLVRNKNKASFLMEWGAELIYGDLTKPETIPNAFLGVSTIIDASTTRPSDMSKLTLTDWYGKLALIETAKALKIKRFIFFSVFNADKYPSITIMKLKSQIEKVLIESEMNYTIFRLGGFFQALITDYAIPILEGEPIWITSESTKLPYMDTQDIAKFVTKSLSLDFTKKKIFNLKGDRTWESLEIINLCEKLTGQKAQAKFIPLPVLSLVKQANYSIEWDTEISNRIDFIDVLSTKNEFIIPESDKDLAKKFKINNILSLETYLQEYFEKMFKNLSKKKYNISDNKKLRRINI